MIKMMIIGAILIAYFGGRVAIATIKDDKMRKRIGVALNLFCFGFGFGISFFG